MGFDFGYPFFGIMSFLIPIFFLFVFGVIISRLFIGARTYVKNNHSPRLTVEALVVTKRAAITDHRHHNGGDITGASGSHVYHNTTYFVTFEVRSGDRIEFEVSGEDYGLLVEKDFGNLSFQGSRFLGFERN